MFFLMKGDKEPAPAAGASPSAEATTAEPTEEPTDEATEDETEEPNDKPTKTDLSEVEEGDCLYDSDPSDTSAQLSYVSCDERGEDHYEVLARFDNTTDDSKCADVPGYDTSFTSSVDNFVICARELVD